MEKDEPEEMMELDHEFNPEKYYEYRYGYLESYLRVSYSVAIINIHVKLLSVTSFYKSIAFLVKLLEELVEPLVSFMAFFFLLVVMFGLSFWAWDNVFITVQV